MRTYGLIFSCTLAMVACQSTTDGSMDTESTPVDAASTGSDASSDTYVDTGPPIELTGLDSDNDGLPDEAEAIVGSDPQNPDSDGDGLQDGAEFTHGSNPLKADSDDDGIDDLTEISDGTNPARPDSDFDGFSDGDEKSAGTDPKAMFSWPFDGPKWPDLRHYAEGTYASGFELGDTLPNFQMVDQFDAPLDLYQFHDTIVLLDFSAGWCNPCREAAKVAQALWEDYRDQGFIIIHYLTETSNGAPGDLVLQQGWATEYGLSFPVVRQEQNVLYEDFTKSDTYIGSLPFMVLLDRNMVIDSRYGASSEQAVRTRLEQLLSQPSGGLAGQHPKDAFGAVENSAICDVDEDGVKNFSCGGNDCVDTDAGIHPEADETCGNSDTNCDGRIHQDAVDAPNFFMDADKDGYGDPDNATPLCQQDWPYVADDTDCDDTNPDINPTTVWYMDADKDGAGDPNNSTVACDKPDGYVGNAQDPNDNDADSSGCWQAVSVGRNFSCGLRLDGRVKCWGLTDPSDPDNFGQVTDVPLDSGYVQLSAGLYHGCALKADGSVDCWGSDKDGASTPPPGVTFTSIECGLNLCCGLTGNTGDNVTCWGDDTDGRATPPPGTFTHIDAMAWFHLCGLTQEGKMLCWGTEKGKGNAPSPTVVPDPEGTYTAMTAGHYFSCAIANGGALNCWGESKYGQATPPPGAYQSVDGAIVHTCALKQDNTIACWGSDSFNRTASPPGTFTQLQVNQLHSCALGTDGLIQCWGWPDQGSIVPAGCGD
jgi:alpha-tubulin suppressor-like RCC1 family protein/thiol-disulfide isomerase/thioredoxin